MRLTAFFLTLALAFTPLAGCGPKTKMLESSERNHFFALQVYMDKHMQKAYFKNKTEEERNAYLKSNGLWDRYYNLSQDDRQLISEGIVKVGWSELMVFMTWGNPIDRRRMTGRPASRSEMFTYRFEVDAEGLVRVWKPKSTTSYKAVHQYEMDVYVDDQQVTELVQRDQW